MRTARLQSEDLKRTNQFINALLSKDDVKDQEKPEVPDPPKPSLVNGNSLSFRSEGKARFDPPAPPPQQPLPETPDVPALKRGVTERPKSHPSNTSPIRPDSQIFQLTEALATARKEIEGHSARVRELEETLKKEREAREVAEDLARRLEESALAKINGSAKANGDESVLEEAFEPPVEPARSPDVEAPTSDSGKSMPDPAETTESVAALFQAKLDAMMAEIQSLKQQVEAQKQRAETAEAERDAERKTLAEMVAQFRREEEARRAAATAAAATAAAAEQEKRRSRSRSRRSSSSRGRRQRRESASVAADTSAEATQEAPQGVVAAPDVPCDTPVLSRANTITPQTGRQLQPVQGDQLLMQSLPYASMIGVVLIGMGLMAYINGWQVQPRVEQ